MSGSKIKKSLLEIASRVKPNTTIEEVYEQLAMLSDVSIAEEQEKYWKVSSHADVKKRAKKWLK
jgi:hypothetical protein